MKPHEGVAAGNIGGYSSRSTNQITSQINQGGSQLGHLNSSQYSGYFGTQLCVHKMLAGSTMKMHLRIPIADFCLSQKGPIWGRSSYTL